MALRIKDDRSLVTGVLFFVVGVAAFIIARGYPFSADNQIGPGAFPTVLGALLTLMGVAGIVRALTIEGEPLGRIALKPVLAVTAAVGTFAFAIDRFGLVVAIALLVPIASLASQETRWAETAVITIVLTALSVGIFIYGLNLPFTLFGGR
jgi:Tripartite tricarboxylate transporter TctB family